MNIESKKIDEVTILYPEGELSLYDASDIRKYFEKLVAQEDNKVILNFNKIDFIDSSGLGALIHGMKLMQKNDGVLYMCEAKPKIYGILKMVKLDSFFPYFETEAEAFHKINQPD